MFFFVNVLNHNLLILNEITTHILWKKHGHFVHSVGGEELVLSLTVEGDDIWLTYYILWQN